MSRKSGIGWIIREFINTLKTGRAGVSIGVYLIAVVLLSVVLSYIVTSAFDLSSSIRLAIGAVVAFVGGLLSYLKPRLVLALTCIIVSLIGFSLLMIGIFVEDIGELEWNVGLVGVGASIVAIGIAVYALLMQTQRRDDGAVIIRREKAMNSVTEGYVWIEEIKKYRCEYCVSSGKYCYFKTSGGIKRHIRSKHV